MAYFDPASNSGSKKMIYVMDFWSKLSVNLSREKVFRSVSDQNVSLKICCKCLGSGHASDLFPVYIFIKRDLLKERLNWALGLGI
jgi:hypothetical protein